MARRKAPARRSYGDGSSYQTKKGEWFASFPLGDGRKTVKRFRTEQAADAWRAELKKQRDTQAIDIASAQTTFSVYANAWIAKLRKPKPSTIASYRDLLAYYILDFVEDVRLADLRKSHFDTLLHTLLDEEYAISQIRNAINLSARILDDALAEDLIPKNYAALVRKDVPANPESIGVVLTYTQIRSLLAATPYRYSEAGALLKEKRPLPSRFEALYWITVLLGLRKGEALGLAIPDIDVDHLTIKITQQVQYVKGAPQIVPPKSPEAVRTLPITAHILELIAVQIERLAQEQAKAGSTWTDHQLLFPAENGKPKEPSNFLRDYKGLLIAAKLPAELRFHDLRHTAATVAGEAGMEEYVIAAMLGHRKGNVTRKYAKATIEQMRTVIAHVEQTYLTKAAENKANSSQDS